MVTFNLDIPTISMIALAVGLIAMIMCAISGLWALRKISTIDLDTLQEDSIDPLCPGSNEDASGIPPEGSDKTLDDDAYPKVSVIASASDGNMTLDNFIDAVMRQTYPDFELIVVFDAGAEATALISEKYMGIDNLYITFIPPESQNLSRTKLAHTIGFKAAKGDVVLTTSSNCIIPSDNWLTEMMRPFARSKDTEVVLGYARMLPDELCGWKRHYREWFTSMGDFQWIAYGLANKTYRGNGYNLAFRRELFFRHKGYASTINLHHGDDDLFVNEISNTANTATVISHGAILKTTWGEAAPRIWAYRRECYDFTSKWLPKGPFLRAGFASFSQWITVASFIISAICALPNLLPSCIAIVCLSGFFCYQTVLYNSAALRIEAPRLKYMAPLYLLWRPIGNRIFRWRHRSDRIKNFTWQRHRRRRKK